MLFGIATFAALVAMGCLAAWVLSGAMADVFVEANKVRSNSMTIPKGFSFSDGDVTFKATDEINYGDAFGAANCVIAVNGKALEAGDMLPAEFMVKLEEAAKQQEEKA